MDIEIAKRIAETLESINKEIFGLLPYLEERCSEEEFKKIKREIARVSNGIDLNFYPLILNQYPELNPLQRNE